MEWLFNWIQAGEPDGLSHMDAVGAGLGEIERLLAGYKDEENPFTLAKVDEAKLLVQALVYGWMRHRLTAFLEEFEVISVEKEISALLAPGVTLNARADLVVRRKVDGLVFVWNWKCEHPDQLVDMADGTQKLAKEVQVGDLLSSGKVTKVGSGGLQDRWLVKTARGRHVRVSGNHPFLVRDEWIMAKNLRAGDALTLSPNPEYGPALQPGLARILGYLVGDGGLSGESVLFTNRDYAIQAHVAGLAYNLGLPWPVPRSKQRPLDPTVRLNGAVDLLRQHGLMGKVSSQKFVPAAIQRADKQAAVDFLGALFDCDGHINTTRGQPKASFYTTSRQLADGIQGLLTKLGVPANVWRQQGKRYKGRAYPFYWVYIQSAAGVARLGWLLSSAVISEKKRRILSELAQEVRPSLEDSVASVEQEDIGETMAIETDTHTVPLAGILTHNTTGNKSQWTKQWRNEIQIITESLAVEDDLGEPVAGVIMEGLYKGYSKDGVFQTPLLWAWQTKDGLSASYVAGAKRIPMWQDGRPRFDWIDSIPPGILDAQFVRSEPIPKNNDVVRDWLAQVVHNSRSDSYVLGLPKEAERERELHFDQRFGEACDFCQFREVCFKETEMEELVKDGVLVERVDHHAQAPAG